jgi:predicted PurR-regulated permease PerM
MSQLDSDRRRLDRRTDHVSLADYTVPELRKALLTFLILAVILTGFLYMVSEVMVAVIAGVVAGTYLLPLQRWISGRIRDQRAAAILTIVLFTLPLCAILAYSWIEISGASSYLNENQFEVTRRLGERLRQITWLEGFDLSQRLPYWVDATADQVGAVAEAIQETIDLLLIGVAVFLFTSFYVLTDHQRLLSYVNERIPGRYRSLVDPITRNIRQVVYGVLYGTFLTQAMKSLLILVMNLAWDVPLAIVLAIASFFIGLLPIVGSWSIYTPVAIYLMLWRGDVVGGVVMLAIGFLGNTLFISTYLRPKIAAAKSRVLNFYWMFIALVTGVFTFGLMGIIIGPVLIAVLKAVLDAVVPDGLGPAEAPVRAPDAALG